jgi:hypothetical protein
MTMTDEMIERAEFVAAVHKLADFYRDHPDIPAPYELTAYVYADISTARLAMHLAGLWSKDYMANSVYYGRDIRGTNGGPGEVSIQIIVPRGQVCERVQTGVRHVEAVPAHDEPVFEWQCSGTDDDVADAAALSRVESSACDR